MSKQRVFWCVSVAATAAWLASCGHSSRVTVTADMWNEASTEEGRRLYRAVCAGCHGADGKANTAAAQVYFPTPRNLTIGEYRFRTTASGTIAQPGDLLRTIADGLPGTAMPAWKHQMTGRQLMSVVLYVQSLSPRFRDEDEKLEADDILVDTSQLQPPPLTEALISQGRNMYVTLKCGECHGDKGRGDGLAAPTVKNQDGTKGHVFDFTSGNFKGGRRPVDVYRTFMTGLDGTAMPSYADSIPNESDRWALVYYVLSLTRERGAWDYLSERPTWYEPSARR